MKLRPFQKEILEGIYDSPTRTAIISFARKNGKTALSAAIVLLHLVGPEAQPNSQLYSSAMSRDQAAVLFNLAAKMVRLSPDLNRHVTIRETLKELHCRELGTMYKALSADAPTKHGLSPLVNIHDELGQVRGPRSELYDVLETGMGAHEHPLSIIISTQAQSDGDLLSMLIDDAMAGNDNEVKCFLYTAPPEDDPFDVDTIRKANPAYGDFLNEEELRKAAEKARRMPAFEASFRNLHLNQRVESEAAFISPSIWRECAGHPESLDGMAVYGGLDLSSSRDLTALVLVGMDDGGLVHAHCRFWLPDEGLTDRAHADRAPYDVWRDRGYLDTVPGPVIEYAHIASALKEAFDRYDIRTIAYDRWRMQALIPYLKLEGFDEDVIERRFESFGQGYKSMSPAVRELERLLYSRRLRHGGNPILTWNAANAMAKMDAAENIKLVKKHESQRIDGLVALAMAVGAMAADSADASDSVYERRGVLVL